MASRAARKSRSELLGLAKSRRDLSRAAIDAAGTCDADPFQAKSPAWTRQGGVPKLPVPNRDYVDGCEAFAAAWLPLSRAPRGRPVQPCHDSPMMASGRKRREQARKQADPVHAGCYGDLSTKRSGDRHAGSRNHWRWRL